jgi:hypothetical protein
VLVLIATNAAHNCLMPVMFETIEGKFPCKKQNNENESYKLCSQVHK